MFVELYAIGELLSLLADMRKALRSSPCVSTFRSVKLGLYFVLFKYPNIVGKADLSCTQLNI
jgi:hypothetical protein